MCSYVEGGRRTRAKKGRSQNLKSLVVVSFIEVGFNAVFKAWEK